MNLFRSLALLFGELFDPRLPVILFVSGPRGLKLLEDCLHGDLKEFVRVVAVFTDDPVNPPNGDVRFWNYPCFDPYRQAIVRAVRSCGIPGLDEALVHAPSVEAIQAIHHSLSWIDRLRLTAMMCGLGCKISAEVIEQIPGGFFNCHPSSAAKGPTFNSAIVSIHGDELVQEPFEPLAERRDRRGHPVYLIDGEEIESSIENDVLLPGWPSDFGGPQPWEEMMLHWRGFAVTDEGKFLLASVILHTIDAEWDGGVMIGKSVWFPVISAPADLPLFRDKQGRYVVTDTRENHQRLGSLVLEMHQRAITPTLEICRMFLVEAATEALWGLRRFYRFL